VVRSSLSESERSTWENRLDAALREIPQFCKRWGITELSLFGSVIRTDFKPDSDVDVLVTFRADVEWSLVEWIEMRDELQNLFGRRVDFVEKRAIRNPFRRQSIMDTQRIIYAA
jgi:predicted nucleotidyltransferase